MATIEIAEEQTYEAIKALAEQMHKSIEKVVAIAVVEKLGRDRASNRVDGGLERQVATSRGNEQEPPELTPEELVERWMKITDDLAGSWEEPWKSGDHGELLYDENGLPK